MTEKAINHIVMIQQHSFDTLNTVKGAKENWLEIFLLLMLDRLYNCSKSVELLLREYIKHPTHDFAIGILLRSGLLDTIVTINLFSLLEENKGKSEEEIKGILEEAAERYLSDGFNHLINHLERDQKENYPLEDLKESYNNLVSQYSTFFKEYNYDGSKPKTKYTSKGQKDLYSTIRDSPTLKNLSDIVSKYEFFSKYDHFTRIHYDMIRQPLEIRVTRITQSIEHLVFHSLILHTLIKNVYSEEFFEKQSHIIATYISEDVIKARENGQI